MNNLDYRTQQNIDKQAAQRLAEAMRNLMDVIDTVRDSVLSAGFDLFPAADMPHCRVHLPGIADVHQFCGNAKLREPEIVSRYFEYGGVSDDVYYFCLLEPDVVKALGLKLEEGADPNGTDL